MNPAIRLLPLLLAPLGPAFAQGLPQPAAAPAPVYKSLDQVNPGRALPSLDPADPDLSQTPLVIRESGRYYLTRNLVATNGDAAIVVEAPDVTLDLRGHRISHRSAPSGQDVAGIEASPLAHRLVVRDGVIQSFNNIWRHAVRAEGAQGVVLEGLTVESTVWGLSVGDQARVRDCLVRVDRGKPGVAAGADSVISSCVLNRGRLEVGPRGRVEGCLVTDDEPGAYNFSGRAVLAEAPLSLADTLLAEHVLEAELQVFNMDPPDYLGDSGHTPAPVELRPPSNLVSAVSSRVEGSVAGVLLSATNYPVWVRASHATWGGGGNFTASLALGPVYAGLAESIGEFADTTEIRDSLVLGRVKADTIRDSAVAPPLGGEFPGPNDVYSRGPVMVDARRVRGCLVSAASAPGHRGAQAERTRDSLFTRFHTTSFSATDDGPIAVMGGAVDNAIFLASAGGGMTAGGGLNERFVEFVGNYILGGAYHASPGTAALRYWTLQPAQTSGITERMQGPWHVAGNHVAGVTQAFWTNTPKVGGQLISHNHGFSGPFLAPLGEFTGAANANLTSPP